MNKKSREVLKGYFQEGALPTADHFASLVESSLNMLDEGFHRSEKNGFEIKLQSSHSPHLISFFQDLVESNPQWSLSYDKDAGKLCFFHRDGDQTGDSVLTLSDQQQVGINQANPQYDFDVGGVSRTQSRIGGYPTITQTVPADGEWHDITEPLNGCHAFEVMAGAGHRHTGRYGLMHAIAMNAYNPRDWLERIFKFKKKINYTHAFYLSRGNKLKLRWQGSEQYTLQIKSNCRYGEGIEISFHLTQLWLDSQMIDSQPALQDRG